MSKFMLSEAGDDNNKVTVELAVPGDWQAGPADAHDPSWKMDGAKRLALATVGPSGSDDAARIEKTIKMNFDDPKTATRATYPDGRVWVTEADGANLHARMFVPYAGGVAMGIALLSDKSKLDSVKAVFETMKIAK